MKPTFINRAVYKLSQIIAFYRHTRTPFGLALDSIKLKQSRFVAESGDGLKLSLGAGRGESFTFFENMVQRVYLQNGVTLSPGATVVDIGANIGAFAVQAGAIVGPRGRVITFEPIMETFERLLSNVALNDLQNVTCRRAAIDSHEGTLTLRILAKSAFASAHEVNGNGEEWIEETVPCLTLDQVIKNFKVDRINLLKVDCEGSEHGIFETLSAEAAARIDQIAMEVHSIEGASKERLYHRLVALGFQVHRAPIWVAFNAGFDPSIGLKSATGGAA
jgi:FkbM family methyltransferase